jgi:hypothetical protein
MDNRNPIERAARALCENPSEDPDEIIEMSDGSRIRRWQAEIWRVRAVIAAIREPSEAMLAASGVSNLKERIVQLENSALMAGFGGVGDQADGEAADILRDAVAEVEGDWHVMIDALLEKADG